METPPGFNLDAAVAAWRDELARQPGLTTADLRELEAHLRDGFAELRKLGLRDNEAFLIARLRVGPPKPVAAEFTKASSRRRWRWRVFGAVFLIVFFGAFVFYLNNTTPEYVATASLRVLPNEITAMDSGIKDVNDSMAGPEEFNTRIRLMETRDVAMGVAGRMTDKERAAFLAPFQTNNSQQPEMNLVDRLMSRRQVTPGRMAYIIQVGVEHPDPQVAAKVADYFAEEFINYNDRLKVEKAMKAVEELEQAARDQGARIEQIQKSLDDLQTQIPNNSAAQAKYDQLQMDKAAAEEMYGKQERAIEEQRAMIILGSENYQMVDHASASVIQSQPKMLLLLSAGFFTALCSAFVVTLLAFVWDTFRRPPPPQLAS